jgi:regulator of sirC expression with transglutaminase-like and TPR domain
VSDPRAALVAIGALPDAEIDIAEAALQLARVDAPEADWRACRTHLSRLAREAAAMASDIAEGDAAAQAAALAELMVAQHSYVGDAVTYDDLANANLIRVIERRRGLPVALGVLWLHAAHAAGWTAHGIDFPGHFLVALTDATPPVVIDPFAGGRVLDVPDLHALLRRVEGPGAAWRPALLAPMGTRAVLLRLQNNIRSRRERAGDAEGALTCLHDMLRIAPQATALWWEAARLAAQGGAVAAALAALSEVAALAPAEEAAAARAAMEALRSRLN